MDRELLIGRLRSCFSLRVDIANNDSGRGYKIHFHASWPVNNCEADYFRVQLVGINPLTGKDVVRDGVEALFSFDRMKYETNTLTYHGRFSLKCIAILKNGEEIVFEEKPINLKYLPNEPYVQCGYRPTFGGFQLVKMASNCWPNIRGKLWMRYGGHMQHINLPMEPGGQLCFYLPTREKPELIIKDKTIKIRNGR